VLRISPCGSFVSNFEFRASNLTIFLPIRPTDSPPHRLTVRPTNRLTDQPPHRLTDSPTNRPTASPPYNPSIPASLFFSSLHGPSCSSWWIILLFPSYSRPFASIAGQTLLFSYSVDHRPPDIHHILPKRPVLNIFPVDPDLVRPDHFPVKPFRIILCRKQFFFIAVFQCSRAGNPRPHG